MSLIDVLRDLGAASVGLALDMDRAGWAASKRLGVTIADNGFGIGLLVWDERFKGLDDLVAGSGAGGSPGAYEILSGEAAADYLEAMLR